MRSGVRFFSLVIFVVVGVSCGMKQCRDEVLSEIEQKCFESMEHIGDENLLDRFKKITLEHGQCSNVSDALSDYISRSSLTMREKEFFKFIIAKIEPYARCADSLNYYVNEVLPNVNAENVGEWRDSILRFLGGVFASAKKVQGDCDVPDNWYVFMLQIDSFLPSLLKFPVVLTDEGMFPLKEEERETFDKWAPKLFASEAMRKALIALSEKLRSRQFKLTSGGQSCYLRDSTVGVVQINLSERLAASAFTNTKLYSVGDLGKYVYHSIKCEEKSFSLIIDVIHEVFHHLDRMIYSQERLLLSDWAELLEERGCDKSYVSLLSRLWTSENEFRNITGLVLSKETDGTLDISFGKYTEGGVVDYVRASHTDLQLTNAPIELYNLIREARMENTKMQEEEEDFKKWLPEIN